METVIRRDIPALSLLSESEFRLLQENHKVVRYGRNDILYKEGDLADDVKLVVEGKVKIYKEGIGREQIVKLAKVNDFIGYRAVMADEAHKASAQALEDVATVEIPKEIIFRVLRENSQLAEFLIKSLAQELGFSRYRGVTLSQKQIRGRLAESIIVLRDKYGYRDGWTIDVNLSREDLANLSNMTTSNCIRTLSSFASEGIIKVDGRAITVLDEKLLEKISRLG